MFASQKTWNKHTKLDFKCLLCCCRLQKKTIRKTISSFIHAKINRTIDMKEERKDNEVRWKCKECDKRHCHSFSTHNILEFARFELKNNRKIIPKMFPKDNYWFMRYDGKSSVAINSMLTNYYFVVLFLLWIILISLWFKSKEYEECYI